MLYLKNLKKLTIHACNIKDKHFKNLISDQSVTKLHPINLQELFILHNNTLTGKYFNYLINLKKLKIYGCTKIKEDNINQLYNLKLIM